MFSKPITWISGNGSCGKTKLAKASAHALEKQGARALFWTGETFLRNLLEVLRQNRSDAFQSFLRSHEYLFIDDLDYVLRDKPIMQTEISHLFGDLLARGDLKIILTCRSVFGSLQNLRLPLQNCHHLIIG